MANLFDGPNLTITLEAVVDGVLTVDVLEDLYEDAKDWYRAHPDNRKYPFPFVSDGGNPLTSIINQGSYIFLQNEDGWRIKPAENDGTYYFIGNLGVQSTALPALIPTDGGFTAAILGLQPVTQGVTAAMGSQLEQVSFNGGVAISPLTGIAGTGIGTNGNPIGTRNPPSNNIDDGHYILMDRGLDTFFVMDDLTISTTDLSMGHAFIGDSPFITLTIDPAANVSNCSVTNLTIIGEMDGLNLVERCSMGLVTNVSGFIHKSSLTDNITLSGETSIIESYSNVPDNGYPTITVGAHDLQARDYHGSLGLASVTGGNHSIEIYGGKFVLDNSCTGGTIVIRGNPFEIIDNSNGTTIIDQTDPMATWANADAQSLLSSVSIQNKILRNKTVTDPASGTMTVYDDNGIDVLFTCNIWENVAGTDAYQGNAVNRRDRLA